VETDVCATGTMAGAAVAFAAAFDSTAADGTPWANKIWGTNPDKVRTKRKVLVFFMAGLAQYGYLTGYKRSNMTITIYRLLPHIAPQSTRRIIFRFACGFASFDDFH